MRSQLVVPLLVAAVTFAAVGQTLAAGSLIDKFRAPDPEARPEAWWHWVGSYATKEGIEADIRAMSEAGVKRAHIFMAANAPFKGPVILSDEWFELYDAVLDACRRHRMTIGLHNCPGWSSSGGPWIKPEDSMKIVTATETDTDISAGEIALPQPEAVRGFYRDIAVLAFPAGRDAEIAKMSGNFDADFGSFLKRGGEIVLPLGDPGTSCELVWEFARPSSFRSAVLCFREQSLSHAVAFASSRDGVNWEPCGETRCVQYQAPRTPKISHFPKRVENVRFLKATFTCVESYDWIRKGRKALTAASFTDLPRIAEVDAVNSADVTLRYRALPLGASGVPGLPIRQIVDVTASFDARRGVLNWRAPAPGTWRILRIGYTSTGVMNHPTQLKGLECDKLSRRGLDAHWPHMPQRVLDRPGAKGIVRSLTIDSWEVGGQNWTEGFEGEFRRRRGYDLVKWLPSVFGYVVGCERDSMRFLHDFQRTVADLVAENYYAYFAELCRRAGVLSATEAQVGPFDPVECNQHADMPMGEFWITGTVPNATGSVRSAASAAHLAGRALVGAEAFTTWKQQGKFQITPHELRVYGDSGWREGVTQLIYHSYAHQPFLNVRPGMSLSHHGTHLTRNTTWWPEMRAWTDYVMRGQTLLQATKAHAQVLFFIGEDDANIRPYPHKLVNAGYDFDYCGFSDIARIAPRPDGGCGVPGGESYDLLLLGPARHASLPVLKKVRALLDAGVRVAGVKPLGTTSLEDDTAAWQKLADEIWGGKYAGRLVPTADPLKAVREAKLRPAAESCGAPIQALRKEFGNETLYLVLNAADKPFAGTVSFAVPKGGRPVVLDAVTGDVAAMESADKEPGRVEVPVDLRARGSCFLLFTDRMPDGVSIPRKTASTRATLDLSSDWRVSFDGLGAPSARRLDALTSWSASEDAALRYFAGRGVYAKSFVVSDERFEEFAASERVTLDLGAVYELARVKLNGHDLGCVWEEPFRVSVKDALVRGTNALEVIVYNTWPNRMIGDAIARRDGSAEPKTGVVPDWVREDRSCSGTGIYTWSNFSDAWTADDPLRPAGLVGPVRIQAERLCQHN